MKTILWYLILIFFPLRACSQNDFVFSANAFAFNSEKMASDLRNKKESKPGQVYKIRWLIDAPLTALGAAWSLYAFPRIYDKEHSTEAQILSLNKDDINGFDRWAAGNHSEAADRNSNYLFYGAMPLPFLLFVDKDIRRDAAKISFLYLEAMSVTGKFYTGSTYYVDRYRPETYDLSIPVSERTDGNYKNSFLAGHVALVATSTFFMAKVYSDYHPESNLKWVLYGGAVAATGTTIYLRHIAGKHFPSDLVAGTALGVLSGILTPQLHKIRNRDRQVWIMPYLNEENAGYGLSFTYRFR